MAKCSFCNKNIESGTGHMYVLKSGKIMHYCTNKCFKNQNKLKRKSRDYKWTKND